MSSQLVEIEYLRVIGVGRAFLSVICICKTSTCAQEQPRQPLFQLLLPQSHVLSARVPSAPPTMPADSLVALAEVLGSGIVGILPKTSITLGQRA